MIVGIDGNIIDDNKTQGELDVNSVNQRFENTVTSIKATSGFTTPPNSSKIDLEEISIESPLEWLSDNAWYYMQQAVSNDVDFDELFSLRDDILNEKAKCKKALIPKSTLIKRFIDLYPEVLADAFTGLAYMIRDKQIGFKTNK